MNYDELTQAQLDRLTEGFKRRIAELERQLEVPHGNWDALDQAYERMSTVVLAALSGAGIATPERGYRAEPWAVSGDLERLVHERDAALARIAELERQLEVALHVHFEVVDRPPDPAMTPPVHTFSVRRG